MSSRAIPLRVQTFPTRQRVVSAVSSLSALPARQTAAMIAALAFHLTIVEGHSGRIRARTAGSFQTKLRAAPGSSDHLYHCVRRQQASICTRS